MTKPPPAEARFWAVTAPLLGRAGVTRSTMMGLPCLRMSGRFFASFDRRTGNLLVKIPEARVDDLIATAHASEFAPAGHRFREWAAISPAHQQHWSDLLDEALEFVAAPHQDVNPTVGSDNPDTGRAKSSQPDPKR